MTMLAAIAFIKKYHAPVAWALAVALAIACVIGFAVHERRIGALGAELNTTNGVLAVAKKQADSLDDVLKVQSLSADDWHAKYIAARAQPSAVTRRVDTVFVTDTVTITAAGVVVATATHTRVDTATVGDSAFATVADSAVNSCTKARHTCAQDLAADSQVIAALNDKVHILTKRQPSAVGRLAGALVYISIGFLGGKLVH